MDTTDLLSIGSFGLASGLSVSALRHYDDVGILKPAYVDPVTGYRRYRPEQLDRARLITALRRIDLPIDAIRELTDGRPEKEVLGRHRERLLARVHVLARMVRDVDHYIEHGVAMPEITTSRIVQVSINVADLPVSIAFYRDAFDASFAEEISSFQFGTWPDDDFFLLTVAHGASEHGIHEGPTGASRFGLLVSDVDAAHARAVKAGATEVWPPNDQPWKPRSSSVLDPSGNRIDLFQG